ncbi:Uncharacterised protein [Shigella sonnei]|nr:Uncharacterised protein [Shigella sonnei]
MNVIHIHHTERQQDERIEADTHQTANHLLSSFCRFDNLKHGFSDITALFTVTDQGNFIFGYPVLQGRRELTTAAYAGDTVCRQKIQAGLPFLFTKIRFHIADELQCPHNRCAVPDHACKGLVKRSPPERLFAQPAVKAGQFQFRIVESFQNFHISAAAYSCPRLQGICNAQPADRPDHC